MRIGNFGADFARFPAYRTPLYERADPDYNIIWEVATCHFNGMRKDGIFYDTLFIYTTDRVGEEESSAGTIVAVFLSGWVESPHAH